MSFDSKENKSQTKSKIELHFEQYYFSQNANLKCREESQCCH